MSCYNPLRAFKTEAGDVVFDEKRRHGNITKQIELPCGRCIGCRMQRVSHWATRITHEAQSYKASCFVTLTYGNGRMPENGSLDHRDYQLFIKRLAKNNAKPIRYYMCGEYGDETGRPHYHACIFNHAFNDRKPRGKSGSGEAMYESDELSKTWGQGNCTVQDLNPKTAAYCAGYIMKKTLGENAEVAYDITNEETGEIHKRKPPYASMSLKPGIGAAWIAQHGKTDAFAFDYVIVNGDKRPLPPYYTKLLKRQNNGVIPQRTEELRMEKQMKINPREQWEDRLTVRETVHQAKIRQLKRTL